jgi:plasmid replication initiation protein
MLDPDPLAAPSELLPERARQPEEHHFVIQQNQLVEARYSLSPRELKLVLYVCAMVDPTAPTLGKCKVRVEDFAEIAGLDPQDLYVELRDTARAIRAKELILERPPRPGEDEKVVRSYLSWFSAVDVDRYGDGYIRVTLNPELQPYLLQLHRDFTAFRLGFAIRLQSRYSIRLYQLLKRWAYRGQAELSIDDLRVWLGTRRLDRNGEVVEETLAPYKSFKARALQPAVDEINRESDLSVTLAEIKVKGSKAVAALAFKIRANVQNASRFNVTPAQEPGAPELSPGVTERLEELAQEFGLSVAQAESLKDYALKDGINYILEKADVVRSRPRDNAAACFIAALRGDWKKPVPIAKPKPKPKNKAPLRPPEPPPTKPDFEPMARLWSEATESQRTAWLKDDLLCQTAPKKGEQPRPIFLARLYCLTQPVEA